MPFYRRPDGCRLYYELHGPGGSDPILLLEGMGGDIPGWGRHLDDLAAEVPVIAYDFQGNGRSDKPDEPQTMATFVEDTVGLLDHLGVEEPHFYGQSFGGMVAQEIALSYPERVRSLVLACTHAGRGHVVGAREKVPIDRPWLALFSQRFAEQHPDLIEEQQGLARRSRQPPHAARRQWEAVQGFDAYDRLPVIRVPALVLHGTGDRTIPAENARVLADRIPGARLALLEGAGHMYHWERPAESARAVLEFVRAARGS